jgi:cyclomaltodextrinase
MPNNPTSSDYTRREQDWRNGALIYQVFVDRFAEPQNLEAKRDLYASPRRLHLWSEPPTRGTFLPEFNVWSHEIDFWGGDLQSLRSKLDYLDELEMDVLYLNPIHAAFTNHKYDASNFMEISPEYGTRADLQDLIDAVHQRGMRLVLDGVFNHVGLESDLYKRAAKNPASPQWDWFYFGDQYSRGIRLWANAPNHPRVELRKPGGLRLHLRRSRFSRAHLPAGGYRRLALGYRL